VGRGRRPSSGGLCPLAPALVAVGIQRAWRSPDGGRLYALLQGLATKGVSMLHFESIILMHFPAMRCFRVRTWLSFRKINHCGVHACFDPLSKHPILLQKHYFDYIISRNKICFSRLFIIKTAAYNK
jgi:hypothetical protein